jgi:hypothetical protein
MQSSLAVIGQAAQTAALPPVDAGDECTALQSLYANWSSSSQDLFVETNHKGKPSPAQDMLHA